jgi:quinoprotein glucose dehydrogenase
MPRSLLDFVPVLSLLGAAVAWLMIPVSGQADGNPSTGNGEWTHYTADVRGTRFMPLDQINASNFNKLEVAWRFSTANLGPRPEFNLAATPLMVNGVVYAVGGGGGRRSVVALDAKTGELLWKHGINEGLRGEVAPRRLSGRGVAYWTDGNGDERILYVTIGYRLVALDAKTGQMIQSFGQSGIVDLKVGVMWGTPDDPTQRQIDLETGEIGLHATPTVTGDIVIVGSSFLEGLNYRRSFNGKGLVRAFDVRTGRQIWRFNTMPGPGEFGHETWENGSWSYMGNTGVWTHITVDEDAGLAYLPVETPTVDLYGGDRPGANLFAESIVAVDLKTGVRKWHFQFVHHPVWDHDMSSPAMLVDLTVDGKDIKAIAVPSKQSYLYMFDRITGQPVWPMPETPVPASDVPGEVTWPTQPIPSRPPMYARAYLRKDDLIDFTPELRNQALDVLKGYRWLETPYIPPVLRDPNRPGPYLGAINVGNASGGTNWPGGSLDPETRVAFLQANNSAVGGTSVSPIPPERGNARYTAGGGRSGGPETGPYGNHPAITGGRAEAEGRGRGAARMTVEGRRDAAAGGPGGPEPAAGGSGGGLNVQGLPIVKPPYGVLTAIDLNRGEIKWSVPHGETPDNIRNHPALVGLNIPRTGQSGSLGLLVTRTLVVLGDRQVTAPPGRPRGAMLRAYDKDTGKDVGEVWMPAGQTGSPMTYMLDGKQYIIIAIGGGNRQGEYVAFALPDTELRLTQ